MTPHFHCATVIGVGLLGASAALGLKARGMVDEVRGVGRRQSSLDAALAVGALDSAHLDLPPAAHGADLVLVCTPAALVASTLDAIRPCLSPGAVVTDVASTKRDICAHAQDTWPRPRRFVGSHPMAGSEKFGPEHGRADFYEGSVCLVETSGALDPAARETVCGLWSALGAEVVDIDPRLHDGHLAHTSHLPHVAASALAILADARGDMRKLVGNGFRDTTRIAASRPEVWRDICLTNRGALLEGLDQLAGELSAFRACLEREDAAGLEAFFARGRDARNRIVEP